MNKQRVTLYIESDIWKMIRMFSVENEISASKFIEEVMFLRLMDTSIPERFRAIDSQIDSHDNEKAPDAEASKAL